MNVSPLSYLEGKSCVFPYEWRREAKRFACRMVSMPRRVMALRGYVYACKDACHEVPHFPVCEQRGTPFESTPRSAIILSNKNSSLAPRLPMTRHGTADTILGRSLSFSCFHLCPAFVPAAIHAPRTLGTVEMARSRCVRYACHPGSFRSVLSPDPAADRA